MVCEIYIMNWAPTIAVHDQTPKESFTGRKPDYSHLRVFGCICYVDIPDERRKKLDVKVDKCIFLGYATNSKGYKCYNPMTKAFYVSRDVTFDEVNSWFPHPASRGPQDIVHSPIKENEKDIVVSEQQNGPSTSHISSQWKGKTILKMSIKKKSLQQVFIKHNTLHQRRDLCKK